MDVAQNGKLLSATFSVVLVRRRRISRTIENLPASLNADFKNSKKIRKTQVIFISPSHNFGGRSSSTRGQKVGQIKVGQRAGTGEQNKQDPIVAIELEKYGSGAVYIGREIRDPREPAKAFSAALYTHGLWVQLCELHALVGLGMRSWPA